MAEIPLGRLRQDLADIVQKTETLAYLKDLLDVFAKGEAIRRDTAAAEVRLEDLKGQIADRQAELKQALTKQGQELLDQKRLHESALAAKTELAERVMQEKHAMVVKELKAIEAQVNAKKEDLVAARREFTSHMAGLQQQEADLTAQIKVLKEGLAKLREKVL